MKDDHTQDRHAPARVAYELGFEVLESLGLTASSRLYRARRLADGGRVLFRVPRAEPFTAAQLRAFRSEYELLASLTLPSVPRVSAFYGEGARPAMVLQDCPGELLETVLTGAAALPQALRLGERLAEALAIFHEAGFVHRDFRPANIIVSDDASLCLVDVSLAAPRDTLPRGERSHGEDLAYISPEQTGRVRHTIDLRSDLYSLGVILFRVLSGRVPFEAGDALEVVHSHLARAPASLAHLLPALPQVVADIVSKLLAKAPGDRYQSARGLLGDLTRCRALYQRTAQIDAFPLATRDSIDRVRTPQRLHGRETELQQLRAAYQRVAAGGKLEFVVISGYSGVGKSSLVQALEGPVMRDGGFFISGKFEQGQTDVPYASLAPAFRPLVQQILSGSEQQVETERLRIQDALGVNARVITALIPELELIIGKQPPVPEIGVIQAENRLHALFRRFLAALARPGCPLVFFLDDLQWFDPASRKLLESLLTHQETPYLLLIGAYRDNEVPASHPLTAMIAGLRQAGTPLSEVPLAPLSRADLVGLVADSLHSSPEDVAPLAELIHQKAAGNPLYSIQFLLATEEEGLLDFDAPRAQFRWGVAKIRAKNLSDNVVDLMIGKLRRLPEETQEALQVLACLGNGAAFSTLEIVLDCSPDELDAVFWKAIFAGLIVRSDGRYRFLHDRVQEAAYALVPDSALAAVHLELARLLLSRLTPEEISERVFEIVTQYNRGLPLITDAAETDTLIELEFSAGTKAKAQTAYASARSYLRECVALLPGDVWQARYEFAFTAHLELAECESLVGGYQRADELLDLLLVHARSTLDRAKVYRLRMRAYQLAGRPRDAVAVLLEALRALGVAVPESDAEVEAATHAALRSILDDLRGRSIAELIDVPPASDTDAQAIISLLDDGLPAVYTVRPALFPLLSARAASICVQYGNLEGSTNAYSVLAVLLVAMAEQPALGFEFSELAMRMNERAQGSPEKLRGKLLFHHAAMVNHWCRHYSTSLAGMTEAFRTCVEGGDLVYAGYVTYNIVFTLLETGAPLDRVLEAARKYAVFARRSSNDLVHRVLRAQEQFVATLQGATRSLTSFDDDEFAEEECVTALTTSGFGVGVAFFHVMKQISAFVHGQYDLALESARNAAAVLRAATCAVPEASHHFYYALTVAALYEGAAAEQKREYRAVLEGELSRHLSWAENCPDNFENRRALIAAELARIDERPVEAEQHYEKAIQSAGANGFVHHQALACEVAARFYRGRGLDRIADLYQQSALEGYVRWGATRKVEQFKRENPRLFAALGLPPGSGEHPQSALPPVRSEDFDLLSVIKASQAISQQIELDALTDTLMRIVLESAGAQRAVLLLLRENRLSIAAVTSVDEQGVHVARRADEPDPSELPLSILNYVRRSRERVLLPDASRPNPFVGDDYLLHARSKSILCLPILRQAEFVGALYLENELITDAFSQDRLTVLELLAGQAAISLENARLYSELKRENSERELAQVALRQSQSLLQAVVDASTALIYVKDLQGRFLLVNRRLAEILGRGVESVLGLSDYDLFTREQADAYWLVDQQLLTTRAGLEAEETLPGADGIHSYWSLKAPLIDATGRVYGVCGISTDITERKRAEATLLQTQEQLRQAQKMEAIGNLAGGVAHDFNNLLSVILSYSTLLAEDMTPGDPRRADLEEISASGKRAAELTNQLLAFSRKQVLQPRVLNLNDVMAGAERLLRRLIGEDIELNVLAGADLGNVKVDPGQVEQIIINLAVNARDAMPLGGKLIIETANIELDERYAAEHLGVAAGAHVMLAVTDNGTGMDKATQNRMFEPFFTTKERGKGTGLGLATVFGIVQQSGGNVWVYSEPDRGTTFKIYFPRVDAPPTELGELLSTSRRPPVGDETILLVEDEESVRALVRTILQRAGYHVLEAQGSGDALVICEQHTAIIHLLLTDVIMPRMSGRQLAERLQVLRPGIKVLYMSGYTDNSVVHHGVLAAGVAFLQKPITPNTLVNKVRQVLDADRVSLRPVTGTS